MNEVTRILFAIQGGEPHAAEQLLPLVYEELRKLAAQKMVQEAPGQTLQATGLVLEVYLRPVDTDRLRRWDRRGHFFAAANDSTVCEPARKQRNAHCWASACAE